MFSCSFQSAEAIEEHSLKLLLEQRPHVTWTILDRPHEPANKKTTLPSASVEAKAQASTSGPASAPFQVVLFRAVQMQNGTTRHGQVVVAKLLVLIYPWPWKLSG